MSTTTPSETTEVKKGKTPLLEGWDLALTWVGAVCLGLGLVALFVLLGLVTCDYYWDFLTFDGAIEAVGASLGAVATTFAAIGSALLFIVSLRVQSRELQNSIEELRNSVLAQNKAADNHQQALGVAEEELLLAKQEKEFNVCLRLIERGEIELKSFTHLGSKGTRGLQSAVDDWEQVIVNRAHPKLPREDILLADIGTDDLFINFESIGGLNARMLLLLRRIEQGTLADVDRQTLKLIAVPLAMNMSIVLIGARSVHNHLTNLLRLEQGALLDRGINRRVLETYSAEMERLIQSLAYLET